MIVVRCRVLYIWNCEIGAQIFHPAPPDCAQHPDASAHTKKDMEVRTWQLEWAASVLGCQFFRFAVISFRVIPAVATTEVDGRTSSIPLFQMSVVQAIVSHC